MARSAAPARAEKSAGMRAIWPQACMA
jgi:hypothetical protein